MTVKNRGDACSIYYGEINIYIEYQRTNGGTQNIYGQKSILTEDERTNGGTPDACISSIFSLDSREKFRGTAPQLKSLERRFRVVYQLSKVTSWWRSRWQ